MLDIKDVFGYIKDGEQLVGFVVGTEEKYIFLSPAQVYQSAGVEVNEVEILIGSRFRPEYYKKGEEMFNGEICEDEETAIKDFWIETTGSVEEMRKNNEDKIKNFLKIKKVFNFKKNGKDMTGIELENDDVVFVSSKFVKSITSIDRNEFGILESSYALPEYYEEGEDIYKWIDDKEEKCRKENTIVKKLDIRMKRDIYDKDDEEKPKYYKSVGNFEKKSYEKKYSKYGGPHGFDDNTIDSAFEGNPEHIWNVI